jgi:hypothetical protein
VICPNCFDDIPDNSRDCRACGVNFARWAGGDSEAPKRGRPPSTRAGKAAAAAKAGRGRPLPAAERVPWRRRLRRAVLVLLALAVLGWLLRWAAAPALDRLAVGGTIVYVSGQDGSTELYALDPGQKTPRRLTRDETGEGAPSLSRDGKRVAFVASREGEESIAVIGTDGTGLFRPALPPGRNSQPAWSPDGKWLAFVSDSDGVDGPARSEVMAMSADGRQVVNLSRHEAAGDDQPAWSPGGTRLAFVSDRDGAPRLYSVMADGTALLALPAPPAAASAPAWSPDGARLAFVSEGEVFVGPADGSAAFQRLTSGAGETPRATYALPTWAPDSTRLAAFRSLQQGGGRTLELAVLGPDGVVESATPAEAGTVVWLDRDRLLFLGRPLAGRSWFSIQHFMGTPQVCLRSLRRAREPWLRPLDRFTAWLFALVTRTPQVDPAETVLTEGGAEALDWAAGTADRQ